MLRAGFGASNLPKLRLHLRYRYRPRPATQNWNTRTFASSQLKNVTLTRRGIARTALFTLTAAAAAASSSVFLAGTVYADHDSGLGSEGKSSSSKATPPTSLGSLVRAYAVYSMCSVPALVDASPKILSVLSSIPGVRQIAEAFVRATFFGQFVGADTAEEAIPLLYSFRAANRGVLFAYSVEVDENEATGASFSSSSSENAHSPASSSVPQHTGAADDAYKHIVDEMLHCIDVAADFEAGMYDNTTANVNGAAGKPGAGGIGPSKEGKRTWVAVKMTALLPDAHALIALSSHIIDSRKTLGPTHPESTIPFPGAARIEDLDVLSSAPTPPANPSPLTPGQIRDLRELYIDLHRICTKARERGVKIIVDAEYSWYQPAIDALTLALMREFNSLDKNKYREATSIQPLIYGTFQAYLRRTPKQLSLALEDARKNNYALGVKLVRGAYHPHEIAAHEAALAFDKAHGVTLDSRPDSRATVPRPSLSISPDVEPPVWTEKRDTDENYNKCVRMLVGAVREDVLGKGKGNGTTAGSGGGLSYLTGLVSGLVGSSNSSKNSDKNAGDLSLRSPPRIALLFGTHNWDSCALILKELVRNGLAVEIEGEDVPSGDSQRAPRIKVGNEVVERVAIGQLYGMSDDLTDWVVSRISSRAPFVIKYVPYGALADVMPYLSRRAIENKSVLGDGNAQHERDKARQQIWKRVFG